MTVWVQTKTPEHVEKVSWPFKLLLGILAACIIVIIAVHPGLVACDVHVYLYVYMMVFPGRVDLHSDGQQLTRNTLHFTGLLR